MGDSILERLNDKSVIEDYTFDKYVVGHSNEFAVACAHAVAKEPGVKYNPLLFCGRNGTGKTHLVCAIGSYIREHNPNMRIGYISAEQFTKEVIDSIRNHSEDRMNKTYESLDVLIVDGIQYIAGKLTTQEVFMDIFDHLHSYNKQIILTSDLDLQRIQDLDKHIYCRLSSGVVVKIKQPDVNVRMGIVNRNLEKLDFQLPECVKNLIVKNTSNAFEIEGKVKKMHLIVSTCYTADEITEEMAKEILSL